MRTSRGKRGSECMSPLGKVGGGSAWQVWGIVHFDVAQRAFPVAGVGNGGHRRCRKRGFAWQAWGIVRAACVLRGVASVGNGVTSCVAGHRFAWQARRIVRGS